MWPSHPIKLVAATFTAIKFTASQLNQYGPGAVPPGFVTRNSPGEHSNQVKSLWLTEIFVLLVHVSAALNLNEDPWREVPRTTSWSQLLLPATVCLFYKIKADEPGFCSRWWFEVTDLWCCQQFNLDYSFRVLGKYSDKYHFERTRL